MNPCTHTTRWAALVALVTLSACGGVPLDASDFAGVDIDGDGSPRFDASGAVVDCNDFDPAIYPGAVEECDDKDNDCDGIVDPDKPYYWADADGDGFGEPVGEAVQACTAPTGHADNHDDCDDTDASVNPDARELCDGRDNNCDNTPDNVDVADASYVLYEDSDGDGVGNTDAPVGSCDPTTAPDVTAVADGGDCDDTDSTVFPGSTAFEVSGDGIDQDCDGNPDCTDLDCDGMADIVVAFADNAHLPWQESDGSTGNGTLTVLRSNRDAPGTLSMSFGTSVSTADYQVLDVDQDGYRDIIQVISHAGDGDTWHNSVVYFGPVGDVPDDVESGRDPITLAVSVGQKVAVGDFDGDGISDLAVGSRTNPDTGSAGTAIFSGVGEEVGGGAALEPSLDLDTAYVHAIVAGDLDGDGYDDLVVCQGPPREDTADWDAYDLLVFFGSESGIVALGAERPTSGCTDVAMGNLDADAQLELIVTRGYNAASERMNAVRFDVGSDRSITIPTTFESDDAATVQLVDIDGDDDLDVIFGAGPSIGSAELSDDDSWQTSVRVHTNDGVTITSSAVATLPGHGATRPIVGHFNSDDYLDLVAPGQANDDGAAPLTHIYSGSSSPTVFNASDVTSHSYAPWVYGAAVDYDLDGNLDILATGVSDGFGLVMLPGSTAGLIASSEHILDGDVSLRPPIIVE